MNRSAVRSQSPANVLRKRVRALGRQLTQGFLGPSVEYGGVGRPCQFGDVRHVHDPMVHVTVHGFAGQADLNGTPRLCFQTDRPVRIPPHAHRAIGDLRAPLVPVRLHTGPEVTEGRVRRRPLEPRPVDFDAEDSFLVSASGPSRSGTSSTGTTV